MVGAFRLHDAVLGRWAAFGLYLLLELGLKVFWRGAGEGGKPLLEMGQRPAARHLVTLVEVHSAKDSLEGTRKVALLLAAAGLLFTFAKEKVFAQVETLGDLGEGGGAHQFGAHGGEPSFRVVRKAAVEGVGDGCAEDGIAKELQALVADAGFIGRLMEIGAVDEGLAQEATVGKDDIEGDFEVCRRGFWHSEVAMIGREGIRGQTAIIQTPMPQAAYESNIKPLIEHLLPAQSLKLLKAVAAIADEKGLKAYLVGGVVRDLFLVRENFDLDVSIEGNAQEVAAKLAQRLKGRLVTHEQFGTATVYADGGHVDLAIARTERYARPGALPEVTPSAIEEDLRRRDFTINAIAASISSRDFGRIVDPLGGRKDIDAKRVHVIHDQSFIDDATRIIRAIRYTARYDFSIDPATARLIRQQGSMLKTISGDRIRQEFIRILEEHAPEKALAAGHQLAVLRELHPALVWDPWLQNAFLQARIEGEGSPPVYMALLCFRLDATDTEAVIKRMKLAAAMAKTVRHAQQIKLAGELLGKPELKASEIFEALEPYGEEALAAARAAFGETPPGKRIAQYVEELKQVETSLDGKDLLEMGIGEGPDVGAVLHMLKRARLDGLVKERRGESAMVRAWIAHRVESQKQGKTHG